MHHARPPSTPSPRRAAATALLLVVLSGGLVGRAMAEPSREQVMQLARVVSQFDLDVPLGAAKEKEFADLAPGVPLPPPLSEALKAAGTGQATADTAGALASAVESWQRWSDAASLPRIVMYGHPEPRRVAAARLSARSMCALCAAAIALIDATVDALDRPGGAAVSDEEQARRDQAVMRLLHARQVVLPLRAARASLLLAATEPRAEMKGRLADSAEAIARKVEPVSPWAQAESMLIAAGAMLLRDKPAEALAAAESAEQAVEAAAAPPALRRAVLVESALLRARGLGASRGPITAREAMREWFESDRFVVAGVRDIADSLAAADIFVWLAAREAQPITNEGERRAVQARAHQVFAEIAAGRTQPERLFVYRHAGRHVTPASPLDGLPAVSSIGFALVRMGEEGKAGEAAAALDALIERAPESLEALESDAAFLLARARFEEGGPSGLLRAAEAGLSFSQRFPADDRAPEALEIAASAAANARASAADSADAAKAEDLLLTALRKLHTSALEAERADPWRALLAELGAQRAGRAEPSASIEAATESALVSRAVTTPAWMIRAELAAARAWSEALRICEDAPEGLLPVPDAAARAATQLLELSSPRDISAAGPRAPAEASMEMASRRARALNVLGRPADALTELERSLAPGAAESSASGPGALQEALTAYLLLAREADAQQIAQRLEAVQPGAPRALLARASDRAWRGIEPSTRAFIAGEPPAAPGAGSLVFRASAHWAGDPDRRIMQHAREAWALLLSGDAAGAAGAFESVAQAGHRTASVLRGLGEARLVLKDDARAFEAFRETARALETQQDFARDYFHAWTRMLEILARRGASTDDAATVRREIARLRSLPGALEQPDCMVRLRGVEASIAQSP